MNGKCLRPPRGSRPRPRRTDGWAVLLGAAIFVLAAPAEVAAATALHEAAGKGDVVEVFRLLVAGADPTRAARTDTMAVEPELA